MCGIVGISYSPEGQQEEVWSPSDLLQILLPESVHRGPHAYGWMYCTADGEIHVVKYKGRSDTREAIATMVIPPEHEAGIQWLVGHVRYFTHGSPEYMGNNHPIVHGKIVGVHNGVLYNHRSILEVTGREDSKVEVDSEAIFAAVDHWGHRRGLAMVSGDMVAVYANREKPATLHIARKVGRPLEFVHTQGGGLMFASEQKIMDATGMKDSPYSSLKPHRLVRVKQGRIVERINLPLPPPPATRAPVRRLPVGAWRNFEGAEHVHDDWPDRDDLEMRDEGGMMVPVNNQGYYAMSPALRRDLGLDDANQNQRTTPARRRPKPQPVTVDPEVVRMADQMRAGAKKAKARVRKAAPGTTSSTYKDGDVVGEDKVYYQGLLLTTDEYIEQTGGQV